MIRRRLRLGEEIGRGALGRVVQVHDDEGGEIYAGKILHASHQSDCRALERFAREAEIASRLEHPNLVRVFGVEEVEGERVLLMELVDGPDLAELLAREGRLPEERLVRIARGLAAGLAAAHHAGLIHRDLKPQNVLIASDGRGDHPKIADFGLARAASFDGVEASSFAMVGTPDTIAPESIDPLAVDARSDLYSLGCILFEMTAGRPLYPGATAFAILEAHRVQPIPHLEPDPVRSAELIALIRQLLAKSPADRPQSAAVVERALAGLERGATLAVTGALAVASGAGLAGPGGACASCGEHLVGAIPVCFACGFAQARLEPGRCTLFVVGPGEVTDKLDSDVRQRLLEWFAANRSLGLDAAPLAARVPRLPFPVVTGASESSARLLAGSLAALGLECEVVRGGRFSLPSMRRKAWVLAGRMTSIFAVSTLWMWQFAWNAWPMIFAGLGVSLGGGWFLAGRRVVKAAGRLGPGPSREMERALDRVAGVLPAIEQRRNRESLRAVVDRSLALHEAIRALGGAGEAEDDLVRAIDLAILSASIIDQLERDLAAVDLRNPDADAAAWMCHRDLHASRLLELAAALDALRVRIAAARARAEPAGAGEFDELRSYVSALEEVEAL